MTTADYLESLQDDLDRTVTALELEEGTNFTDIADMAENGDISTGGGGADLSEYFYTTIDSNTNTNNRALVIKKTSDIIVSDNVTDLSYAFYDLGRYSTSLPKLIGGNNVKNLSYIFSMGSTSVGPAKTLSIDVSGLITTKVTNMSNMFKDQTVLTTINGIENLDTSSVTNMGYLFNNCRSLTTLSFGNSWNVTKVTSMTDMFNNCVNLTTLDLSTFSTSALGDTRRMFSGCTSLEKIDMRNFNFSNLSSTNAMFLNVPNNCLIIVKDNTAKTWMNNNFSNLTNVKTVAEYEAE